MGLLGAIKKAVSGIGKAIAGVGKTIFRGIKAVVNFTILKPLKFIGKIVKAILGNPMIATLLGTIGGGVLGFLLGGPIGAFLGAQLGGNLLGGISMYFYQQKILEQTMKMLQAQMATFQQYYAIMNAGGIGYGAYAAYGPQLLM